MSERIFKYMKPDVAKIVLENKTIRFTCPSEFNDIYDAKPPYKFTNPSINETEKSNLSEIFEGLAEDTIILSLSKTNKNLLMWGHYTDSHKGAVIEFYPNAEFLKYCTNVMYDNNILQFKENYNQYLEKNCRTLRNALHKLFTTKNKCWRYEKEKRIIMDKPTRISYLKLSEIEAEKLNKQSYIDCPFKTEDIKAVYLGCKMSDNDELAILNIIKSKYPNVKCYKAEKCMDAYKLKFKKINIE